MMKLFDTPRCSWVRIIGHLDFPPNSLNVLPGTVLFFVKLDGMYSICTLSDDTVVFPAAWTEVELTTAPESWSPYDFEQA